MNLKIRYVDFWPGFQPETFLFTKVLQKITKGKVDVITNNSEEVDLQFNSVFVFKNLREKAVLKVNSLYSESRKIDFNLRNSQFSRSNDSFPAKKYIWYTGENRRAPLENFSYTLSFDKTDSNFNNLYFPYWMTRIDWGFGKGEFEIMPTIEELMQSRVPVRRPLAACVFSGKLENNRERTVSSIEKLLPVSKFGNQYRNPVLSKFETSSQFGIQICLENEISPGYVTEKIQEAWVSRNVPVWAGIQTIEYFNPEAFFDVTNLNQVEIQELFRNLNLEALEDMQAKPILVIEPSITNLMEILGESIS